MTQHWRIAAVAAVSALTLAIGGCGDSPGPAEIGHGASGPITKQRVEEFARAVNLRAGDLPGARSVPADDTPETAPEAEAEAERCFDAAALPSFPALVANVSSNSFAYGEAGEVATFESAVAATHTEEEMAALIEALSTKSGFRCFERMITKLLEEKESAGNRFLSIDFRRLPGPLPLGVPALGVRIHVPFEADGVEHDGYVDFLMFLGGHTQLTLSTFGMPEPVNQNVEAGLISKLLSRAERHAL